jgi:hypothetical protein
VHIGQFDDFAVLHVDLGGSAAPRAMLDICGFAV